MDKGLFRHGAGIVIAAVLCLLGASSAGAQAVRPEHIVRHGKGEAVAGEILVQFRSSATEADVAAVNASLGTSVLRVSPRGRFMRLRIPAGRTIAEMVEAYARHPRVAHAEPNYIARAFAIPNDPVYILQWHLDDTLQGTNPFGGANGGGINVEPAWDITNGSGVVVAVIDTGVAYEDYVEDVPGVGPITYVKAPDLVNTNFVPGYDFVNDDSHPNDDESHGTHVTGTIAQSTNNALGVAGVAYGASIMPIKVLSQFGFGSYADIADGIYFAADNGARVINMSLGGSAPSDLLKNALKYAYSKGVTIVCSAGNDGAPTVGYPAGYDAYCIAVGATRYDETLSWYSNWGPSLDLVAPGGDTSADQNADGYGDGVLQNTFDPIDLTSFAYHFFQGTSMASPHVAGVAALVIASGLVGPDLVREAIEGTAEDKGPPGWDPVYGWGIVDAYAAVSYVVLGEDEWSDNMEGPVDDWTTSGLWHQVHASATYGEVHSGNYAWYYGQDASGNYDTGTGNSGILTSPEFMVRGGGKLAFWHWEETENYPGYDLRQVYIKKGTTWRLVYTGNDGGSDDGMWRLEEIDLSAYIGPISQVRFQFDSVDRYYNDFRGWYIDDVELTAPPQPEASLSDGMEAGSGMWSGASGLWHIVDYMGHASTHSWYYGQDASQDYDTGGRTSGSIRTAPVTLGPAHRLEFWRYESTENFPGYDVRTVHVGSGSTWHLVYTGNYSESDDGVWVREEVDLSAYAGKNYEVKFTFDSVDELYNDYSGWFIDDVAIEEPSAPPAGFYDDMESGTGKWAFSSGLWHIVGYEAQSGTHSWYYGRDDTQTYETGSRTSGWIVTLPISVADGDQLSFWRWEDTENYSGYDIRGVYARVADGWNLIYAGDHAASDDSTWVQQVVDLSAYAGMSVEIGFSFDSVDELYNSYRGWFIDDVYVGQP